jgi:outer membrane protein OmpA-like peptidoglycan-associated protein
LRPEAKEGLDKVATVIAAFPESKVLIESHTDTKGSPKANLATSKKRTDSVKNWFVKEKGISSDHITTGGLGESKPALRTRIQRAAQTPKAGRKTVG